MNEATFQSEVLFVGHDGEKIVDSAETQRQIDRLTALPSKLVDQGEAIQWKALNDPAESRTLLQCVLGDRRERVDKKRLMADRPPIAVATIVDGQVVRLEFYEGHDGLEKTFDLRSAELQGKALPDWMGRDPRAYDQVAFLQQAFGLPEAFTIPDSELCGSIDLGFADLDDGTENRSLERPAATPLPLSDSGESEVQP